VNTSSTAVSGASLSFVVLHPNGGGHYSVVAVDSESLPNPLPASNVASFTLSAPIQAQGGDTIGVFAASGVACYWTGGATPTGDTLAVLNEPVPPTVGQGLSTSGSSSGGFAVNVGATLERNEDASVSTGTAPARPTAGNVAVLASSVTNLGPSVGSIVFTDHVPAGLTIGSASAGDGTCTTSGQTVTCTITSLPVGQSVPVNVVVTPTAANSYTNSVSVTASGVPDPNPANNSASAVLRVGPAPVAAKCLVPKLSGTPGSVAKHVLVLLGCKVKIKHAHSKRTARGLVLGTHPGAGSYTVGRLVTLVVSSGKHH
jgi:uncharacterized repeat protein (TIGR01451 family)